MSHYEIAYATTPNKYVRDMRALADTMQWLGEDKYNLLAAYAEGPEVNVQHVNIALGFAGVSGFPFHAFCRKHCLQAYIAWMTSDTLDGPAAVDGEGFPL